MRALRDRLLARDTLAARDQPAASDESAARDRSQAGERQVSKDSLALYVHMPWCVRKCPYCDFNSHQLKSAVPDASYIDTLMRDF